MTMQVRPIPVFLDRFGNPAINARVYISAPNTYPKDENSQLVLTNAIDNSILAQPLRTDSRGIAKNANGHIVIPIIEGEAYAILTESQEGADLFSAQNLPSDAFGLSSGSSMADANFDTFAEAQALDLSAFDYIWIRSATFATGDDWRATADGPGYGYVSYRTDVVDGPSAGTGDFDDFYDDFGNQWKIDERSQLPLTNQVDISTTNDLLPEYAAEGDYYIDSGAANAYELAPDNGLISPSAYVDGARIRFRPLNENTGASTVDVDSLGVTDLRYISGDGSESVLTSGLLKVGRLYTAEYRAASGIFFVTNIPQQTTPPYLGKKLSGYHLQPDNSASFVTCSMQRAYQGTVYDYGPSLSSIVIPEGISKGFFKVISGGGLGIKTADTITYPYMIYNIVGTAVGDVLGSRFQHYLGGLPTAAYGDSFGGETDTISVTTGEVFTLELLLEGENTFPGEDDFQVYIRFEFVPTEFA